MKVLLILLIFLASTSLRANTCTLDSYPLLITADMTSIPVSRESILKTTCSEQRIRKVFNHLKTDGAIDFTTAKNLFNVKLSPQKISYYNLTEIANEKLSIPADTKLFEVNFISNRKVLPLDNLNQLSLNCSTCLSAGSKNISLNIKRDDRQETEWLTANMKTKMETLVAARSISVNYRPLEKSDFKIQYNYVNGPEQIFTDPEQLKFYQLSRRIEGGEQLTRQHLAPVLLVSPGTEVNTLLVSDGIKLEGRATAVNGGHLGERIRLRHSRTNRILNGKVVDFNQVVLNL